MKEPLRLAVFDDRRRLFLGGGVGHLCVASRLVLREEGWFGD